MLQYDKNSEAISRLSPEQYRVTQQNGTERPFHVNASGLWPGKVVTEVVCWFSLKWRGLALR